VKIEIENSILGLSMELRNLEVMSSLSCVYPLKDGLVAVEIMHFDTMRDKMYFK